MLAQGPAHTAKAVITWLGPQGRGHVFQHQQVCNCCQLAGCHRRGSSVQLGVRRMVRGRKGSNGKGARERRRIQNSPKHGRVGQPSSLQKKSPDCLLSNGLFHSLFVCACGVCVSAVCVFVCVCLCSADRTLSKPLSLLSDCWVSFQASVPHYLVI